MRILFCRDDLAPQQVDSCFMNEAEAARQNEIHFDLIDFHALRQQDGEAAVRFVRGDAEFGAAVYRGWMLTPVEYRRLFEALKKKQVHLINSEEEYQHCHWIPNYYESIKDHTPKTIWIPLQHALSENQPIMNAMAEFGSSPVVLKDYVKSRKHEWFEACYIPDASAEENARRVIHRFLELQGEDLQGGLVIREFVEFEPLGRHPKSGMPITLEYRLFVLDGKVISVTPYWDTDVADEPPPMFQFDWVLKTVKSRFFSCDVAKRIDGKWMILELGDGQVSGLPSQCNILDFYLRLKQNLS